MATATTASVIRTLHRIQRQLTDLRSQLAAGPKQISIQSKRLQNVETERLDLAATLKKARKHADEKQLLLRSSEAKITKRRAMKRGSSPPSSILANQYIAASGSPPRMLLIKAEAVS